MKLRLSILLLAAALAAAPAAGQTIKSLGYNTTNGNIVAATNVTFTNSVGFSTNARAATRTNLGGTTLGNAVFTATNTGAAQVAILGTNAEINTSGGLVGLTLSTNETKLLNPISFPFLGGATAAATSRTNLGLGAADNVTFSNITANGTINAKSATSATPTDATNARGIQWSNLSSEHAAIYGAYDGVAKIGLSVGTSNSLSDVATFRATGMTVASNAVVGGTLAVTGNVTMSGVGNTAPSQTADSASSLMTRELSDTRYSFSRWYGANEILSGAQSVGVNPLISGNGGGHVVSATLVTVSNVNTKFMLPVDYRVSGSVRVVSYWTEGNLTNSGTNGNIAVWTLPFVVQPVTNTSTLGIVNGTQIKNTFTANYGGSGNFRYYVMEQTVNFATVTNLSATNPMQLKWVELQRRSADATDTSSDNIFLSGVHIYVP
jgi:hypothetical protein